MSQRAFEPFYDDVVLAGLESVGDLLRRARARNGWTQRDLGTRCGIDQAVISRLENGKQRGLSWQRFGRLVGTLGGLGPDPSGLDAVRRYPRALDAVRPYPRALDAPESHRGETHGPGG